MKKVILFLVFLSSLFAFSQKKVLFLQSYQSGINWSRDTLFTIENELKKSFPTAYLMVDSLDGKRVHSDEYYESVFSHYQFKYRDFNPDVIIASDNDALKFLDRYHSRLFPTTPVIFFGINGFREDMISNKAFFKGVSEKSDIKKNIDLILTLQPNIKNILLVSDKTTTGKVHQSKIKKLIDSYKNINLLFLKDDTDLDEINSYISKLDSRNSAVFLMSYTKDKYSNMYYHLDSAKYIAQNSKIPVYGLLESYIKTGHFVGGYVTSARADSLLAISLAKLILNGDDISLINNVVDREKIAVFDFKKLQEFNIDSDFLPSGAIILNRKASFYENNRELILRVIALIFALLALIGILLLNIKRRKLAELNLKRSKESYEVLVETMNEGLLYVDKNYKIIYANSKIYEFFPTKLSIERQNLKDLFNEEIHTIIQNHSFSKFDKSYEINFEKYGKEFNFLLSPKTILDDDREFKGIILVLTDISEQKLLERDLIDFNRNLTDKVEDEIKRRQRQEKLLLEQSKMGQIGQIMSSIAHHWRQPLNVISLAIQSIDFKFALNDRVDRDDIEELLTATIPNIEFMSNTIDNFRNLFKPSVEKMDFDLTTCLIESLSLILARVEENKIDFKFEFYGKFFDIKKENIEIFDKVLINGYPNELKHVILNLVNNSIDSIVKKEPEIDFKAQILVKFFIENSVATIEIIDNGVGIKDDIFDKIFDPYFTTKFESRGIGIGLFMSKMIIEKNMDGSISADKLEDGALFRISLNLLN